MDGYFGIGFLKNLICFIDDYAKLVKWGINIRMNRETQITHYIHKIVPGIIMCILKTKNIVLQKLK